MMPQRSPSYIVSLPAVDPIADLCWATCCRPARLSDRAHEERHARAGGLQAEPAKPATIKRLLRKLLEPRLLTGYDIDKHSSRL
jgi:hypothetical protein